MHIILSFILLLVLLSPMQGNWVNSLGNIQSSHAVKQSYMKGLLLSQTYGNYSIDALHFEDKIENFYKERNYHTFWFNDFNEPDLSIIDMLTAIKRAANEGFDTSRYHDTQIEELFQDIQNGQYFSDKERNLASITLDLLLTDAFMLLVQDLSVGMIDYSKFQSRLKVLREARDIKYTWDMPVKKPDALALLKEVKRDGAIEEVLFGLVTNNLIYNNLLDAYNRYRSIALSGGFTKIPASGRLKTGSRGGVVPLLKKRLYQSGDLGAYDENNQDFDENLERALKRFQRRMGIWASGTLTKSTQKALNVPVEKRLAKIKLNLERARWEKDPMRKRYIFVNIPDFMMSFMDGDTTLLRMRVVVGQLKNPTPIFQGNMSYVVLNPTWSVPNSIVTKEMLPRLQEDPDYLAERKFKAYSGWGENRKEIDPFDIDWYAYDEDSTLPYNFVRDPGAGNPLGKVKFMFPNNHAVYMHDTPTKKLFKRSVRAYSHGCIRLQHPQEMLEFVAQNYINRSVQSIKRLQKESKNCSIPLEEKIPVYIRYYTAWVDKNGVNFRNDIYGYDKIQEKLLK